MKWLFWFHFAWVVGASWWVWTHEPMKRGPASQVEFKDPYRHLKY